MVSKASTGGRRVRAVCRLLSSAGSPALLLGVASLTWLLGLLLHPAGSVGAETQPRLVAATDAGTAGADGSGSGSEPSTDGSPGKPAGGGSGGSDGSSGSTGSGDSGSGGASSQDGSGTAEQPSTDGTPAKPAGANHRGTTAQPDSGSSAPDQCASGCGPRPTPAQPSSTGPAADQVDQTATPPRSPDRPRPGQGNAGPATDRAPADSEACRAGGGTDCASPRVVPVNNLAATGSAEPNPGDPDTCAQGRTDCVRPPGPPAGAAQASTRAGTETADGQNEACRDGGPGCTNPLAVMAARTTNSNPAGLNEGIGEPGDRRGCGPGLPCPDQPATPGAPAGPGGPSSAGSGGTGGTGHGGGSGAGVFADRAAGLDPEQTRAVLGVPRHDLTGTDPLTGAPRGPPGGRDNPVGAELDDQQREQLAALLAPGVRYTPAGGGPGPVVREANDPDLLLKTTGAPRDRDTATNPAAESVSRYTFERNACVAGSRCQPELTYRPGADDQHGSPTAITCRAGTTDCAAQFGEHPMPFVRDTADTPAQIAWNDHAATQRAARLSDPNSIGSQAVSAVPGIGPVARIGLSGDGHEIVEMREENRDLARRAFETAAPRNKAQARAVLDRAESDLTAAHQQSEKLDEGLPEDVALGVIPGPWGKAGKALGRGTKVVVERIRGVFTKRPAVTEVAEDGSAAVRKVPSARETDAVDVLRDHADSYLPGLPATAPKLLGRGSTGRVEPRNLNEQSAMTAARSHPAGEPVALTLGDPRWPAAEGWTKMRQKVNGVTIHYVKNTKTGEVDDFKFKSN